ETIAQIASAYEPVYDFATIRAGKELIFIYDHETDELKKIVYEPTTEEQVALSHDENGWHASKDQIVYETRRKKVNGTIESSLYETALEQHLDTRAIIGLAEAFAWQIDFAVDIRKGDTFSMIYEERYRDGNYVMPGSVLAAEFNNAGTPYKGYYYTTNSGHEGFYDADGNSLQKIFLKSPLQYRYISSGFTSARIDPINGHTTPHRAIDYAAVYGTPAVSVGDGTVIRSGWYGGYGYSVDVRHNEMYMTRYGHFSRLAVKAGQNVTQGQIIGYVGSTGHSTGPHLHYELWKFGSPINPLTVELPSTEGLPADILPAFQEYIKQFEL
ncbi:MAG: peptidoglycan DD-metalloendopeptidase family protein, partial [Candidatus Komeilibacteria bacterium]|nr:peptidoglycan DD-metalloendopeptidase family protein [Candidatus Komeilibacteria bacterium]